MYDIVSRRKEGKFDHGRRRRDLKWVCLRLGLLYEQWVLE